MVTLYITPVYYVYLDRVQNWMNGTWSRLTGRAKHMKSVHVTEKVELVNR